MLIICYLFKYIIELLEKWKVYKKYFKTQFESNWPKYLAYSQAPNDYFASDSASIK